MIRVVGWSHVVALLLLMLAGFSNCDVSQAAAPWGEKGTFPHEIVELLYEGAELSAENRGSLLGTVPDRARAIVRNKDRLKELQNATEGERVRARLSVMKVTDEEVHLLPDVTSGFPTLPVEDVRIHFLRPIHSAVRLQETHVAAPTKQLVLSVGESIPVDVAQSLLWNDKVLVDFRVDSLSITPPVPKWVDKTGNSTDWPVIDPQHVYCTVRMSDLRFLSAEMPELIRSHRMRLWPGPGTFPFIIKQLDQESARSSTDRDWKKWKFLDYASSFPIEGAAMFELHPVASNQGVKFYESPLVAPSTRSSLHFHKQWGTGHPDYFILEPGLFTEQELSEMKYGNRQRKRERVLLHFDHTIIRKDANSEASRIMKLTNFRVGSPDEYKAAERLVEDMQERSRQYVLAVASERDRRIEETARRQLEEEEAERKANSFAALALDTVRSLERRSTRADTGEQRVESGLGDDGNNQNPSMETSTADVMTPSESYGPFLWIGAGGAACILFGLALYTQRHRFAGESEDAHHSSSPKRGDPYA